LEGVLASAELSEDKKRSVFSTQKVKLLLEEVARCHLDDSERSRAIVFVKERQTAPALAHLVAIS
jgi:ERCC4-related helicase